MQRDSNPSTALAASLNLGIHGPVRDADQPEYFKMILLDAAKMTHLYELFLFFQKIEKIPAHKALLIFFDLFSGCTIKVPNREVISNAIRDTKIFYVLRKAKHGTRAEMARQLAEEFDLTVAGVLSAYRRMEEIWENHREFEDDIKER